MPISELINKLDTNKSFRKVISENSILNSMWEYLKTNTKTFAAIVLIMSIFSIYKFGNSIGEFLYYITH